MLSGDRLRYISPGGNSMIAIQQKGDLLQVTLNGECDFAVARELLLSCKTRLREGKLPRIDILLDGVTSLNTCTIGAMLALSEGGHGNFQISLNNCNPDLHHLFESGLLTRYFGSLPTIFSYTSCPHCLQENCQFPGPDCIRLGPAQLQAEIAELHLAEQSLQESKDKFETQNKQLTALIEAIPDVIFLKDGEGRWLVTNEPAKKLFRLHDVDWQSKTDRELAAMRPEMRAAHEKCVVDDETAWNAGSISIFEERAVNGQGEVHEFEVRKAPIFEKDGQRKGLVVIGRDITDNKRSEQYARIADATFEAQEAIVITDADSNILRVNKTFTRLTGYKPEEAIGKKPSILQSGRHDKEFYRSMWESLKTERFWMGEVWDRRKNGEIYPKWLTITAVSGPGGEITNYVGAFTDLSKHKEAEDAIYRLAFYDPLTDLPNRRLLMDRLGMALNAMTRSGRCGAIMMIDLDNFKYINDTKGHPVGDQLLIEVAKRLETCVRQGDTIARLGGDEFVIMLEDLSLDRIQAAAQAESIAEKVLDIINQPYQLENHKLHSSPSIGISLFSNDIALTMEEILKRADTAMYQAKNSGRNTMRFFDPDMQELLVTRMALESDLHHALTDNQFRLYYQVQVSTPSQVLGAEVLLRWEHPKRGIVSPVEFIPLAEESGLIVPIGMWVLQTVCAQLKAWEHSPLTRHLRIAVNVSAKQFRQPDFVEQVCNALEQSGVDANRLKLELTESLIVQNVTETTAKMRALKLMGIRFSMDDFGTGYSSLNYLTKLPLDQLKIDKSFVDNIATNQSDAVIAQTIIGMAENLGLNIIAEGVETEEQRACLERLGCTCYQGYLFSKPLPLQEFENFISHNAQINEPNITEK